MKVADFFKWMKVVQEEEYQIMVGKGKEYTVSDEDKLKNFKSIAERMKTTPEKVAMVYLLKHMDSLRNYVLYGIESSDEPINGRIRDLRNYLLLLEAIINENKAKLKVISYENKIRFKVIGYDDRGYPTYGGSIYSSLKLAEKELAESKKDLPKVSWTIKQERINT